jgi:putative colanic acid biosynthesis glycosyltransferase
MTTDRPLFSIVTITRNNLHGLKATARSVETQSFRQFEWIVIDGNSTDGTKEYLPSLPADTQSEPDNGLYDAMNKGIDKSGGDYILFLNAGDVLSDADILATLSIQIKADNPDFLYGDALETGGFYKKARTHTGIDLGMFTHHQAMLYRTALICDLRYDTGYKIAADYGFTRAFLKKAKTISYCPAALCIFETGGVSQQNQRLGRLEQFAIRRKDNVTFLRNAGIYACQNTASLCKKHTPALYRSLKSWRAERR